MEGLTTRVYKGVKGYWRRRGYQRLSSRSVQEESGPKPKPRRRRWGIRISPRLKLKLRGSPKKLYIGLRDAYVRIMMKLANSSVVRGRTMSGEGFGTIAPKEYDEKMIIEIYKTLAMRQAAGQQIASSV